jgi:hypothetical protein
MHHVSPLRTRVADELAEPAGDPEGSPQGVLVLSHGGHPGVDDALRSFVADGSLRAAHRRHVERGASEAASAWAESERIIARDRIELVVLHHYHGPLAPDPRPFIGRLRAMEHRPVVALTCGDSFFNGFFRPSPPTGLRDACAEVDLVLTTPMGVSADAIAGYGAPRVALWPNGACQAWFGGVWPPYRASMHVSPWCSSGATTVPATPSAATTGTHGAGRG